MHTRVGDADQAPAEVFLRIVHEIGVRRLLVDCDHDQLLADRILPHYDFVGLIHGGDGEQLGYNVQDVDPLGEEMDLPEHTNHIYVIGIAPF